MKKLLIVGSMAALLAGCYTAERDYYNEPVGGTAPGYGVYRGYGGLVPPIMNTNSAFYPIDTGPAAALGPGTPSGGGLWVAP
jgi:hypothetical protein